MSEMKTVVMALMLFVMSGIIHAEGIRIQEDAEKGKITVDDGLWRYVFSTESNLLENVVNSSNDLNYFTLRAGGGGHWLYATGGTERRKYIRQGVGKAHGKYEIVKTDQSVAVIRFTTNLGNLTIVEDYTFYSNSGIALRHYDITVTEDIPDMALFCWQAKLGASGATTEPFDCFLWGRGQAVLQNENEMKKVGEIRGPAISVSDSRDWASGYWIKPTDLKQRFIAMVNRDRQEYWMLAFEPDGDQPWYFLGDYGKNGQYSEWFGFRVYGQTVFSKIMPTFSIQKGTIWSGTLCHILGFGSGFNELSKAYQKWLSDFQKNKN